MHRAGLEDCEQGEQKCSPFLEKIVTPVGVVH